MSYPITVNLIPGLPKTPYINGVGAWNAVVNHSTATPNATAAAERTYEASHFNDAFVHYFVDDISIIQVADINYLCYGCGNGNKYGVVQIELCEFSDPTRFKNAYDRYVWLTIWLLRQKNQKVIDKQTVYSHKDIAAKYGGSTHTDPIGHLASHGISWAQHIVNLEAEWNKQEAEAHPVTAPTTLYRVRKTWADATSQIGAFGDLLNAKAVVDSHPGYIAFDNNGNQAYPTVAAPQPATAQLYRVRKSWTDATSQIGAFGDLDNAKATADKNLGYSVFDSSGNNVYTPQPVISTQPIPQPAPAPPAAVPTVPVIDHTGHHDILGKSVVTVEQMVGFVKTQNPDFADLEAIAKAFLEVGDKYGVRGDIAFTQSVLETHYFLFDLGTAVTPDQHNYCGHGVTQKGLKGSSFATITEGVEVQIQHLYGYAVKEQLDPNKVIDTRYKYLVSGGKLGIAPHWEDLNNNWAANSHYGEDILALFNKVLAYVPPVVVEQPIVIEKPQPSVEVPVITVQPTPATNTDEKINVGLLNKLMQAIIDFLSKFFGGK
jgi:N-acetylmuramoyl-L-alanine amidase CwlA